jgi:hypothetical protein
MVYKFRVILDAEEDVLETSQYLKTTLEDLHNAILIPLDLMAWKWLRFTLVMKLGTKKKRFHF